MKRDTQSIGAMEQSTAIGCNVSGTGITITDRRVFIIINGTDTTEQIAEAVKKALACIADSPLRHVP